MRREASAVRRRAGRGTGAQVREHPREGGLGAPPPRPRAEVPRGPAALADPASLVRPLRVPRPRTLSPKARSLRAPAAGPGLRVARPDRAPVAVVRVGSGSRAAPLTALPSLGVAGERAATWERPCARGTVRGPGPPRRCGTAALGSAARSASRTQGPLAGVRAPAPAPAPVRNVVLGAVTAGGPRGCPGRSRGVSGGSSSRGRRRCPRVPSGCGPPRVVAVLTLHSPEAAALGALSGVRSRGGRPQFHGAVSSVSCLFSENWREKKSVRAC